MGNALGNRVIPRSSPETDSLLNQLRVFSTDDRLIDPNGRIWELGGLFVLLKFNMAPPGWELSWIHDKWWRFDSWLISLREPYVVMLIQRCKRGPLEK